MKNTLFLSTILFTWPAPGLPVNIGITLISGDRTISEAYGFPGDTVQGWISTELAPPLYYRMQYCDPMNGCGEGTPLQLLQPGALPSPTASPTPTFAPTPIITPKPTPGIKKKRNIAVMMTDGEWNTVKARAAAAGKAIGLWVEELIREKIKEAP